MVSTSKRILVGCIALTGDIVNISHSVKADQVYFVDGGEHQTSQGYPEHNIFIVNGTTLSLVDGISIVAPSNGKDGEEAVRVEDAFFYAKNGSISGGLGVGGSGVTITTNRNSEFQAKATFEEGVTVYGGDAIRETTTRGGDAVQILHAGSEAVFHGGVFTPGAGCTVQVCGQPTSSGNSLQVLNGKATVMGGKFNGNFFCDQCDIEIHGCVELKNGKITGNLLDGSRIDVKYDGSDNDLIIVYDDSVCPEKQEQASSATKNRKYQSTIVRLCVSLILSFYLSCSKP